MLVRWLIWRILKFEAPNYYYLRQITLFYTNVFLGKEPYDQIKLDSYIENINTKLRF